MYEMVQEQSQLAQKIQAGVMSFDEKLAEFNVLKEQVSQEYKNCCADIDKKFAAMINHTLGDEYAETIRIQKEACYQIYCANLTPEYKAILLERFKAIVASGDDFNRIDVLSNELASANSGSKKEIYKPGLTYLEALMDYMRHLENLP